MINLISQTEQFLVQSFVCAKIHQSNFYTLTVSLDDMPSYSFTGLHMTTGVT